jgi:hypothetical protein
LARLRRVGARSAFAMDMTVYDRSTRPAAMNYPCNLPKKQ